MTNDQSNAHLELLGFPARDKVSGLCGIITSVSFDLYGCIQVIISPPAKDSQILSGIWLDVARIEVTGEEPVMDPPDFVAGYIAQGKKGPADKPMPGM